MADEAIPEAIFSTIMEEQSETEVSHPRKLNPT